MLLEHKTTWITKGDGLRTSCTGTSFQVLKVLYFTSCEDTELIPWEKAKQPLLRLATTPPPTTARIGFLSEYNGFLIGVGSKNDRWFYIDAQGSLQAASGGAIYSEFSTVVNLVVVGLPPDDFARTAISTNEAQACRIWTLMLGPKFCPAQLPRAHLAAILRKTYVGGVLKIVHLLQQCYNLHISSIVLLICMKWCALGAVQMQPIAPPTLKAPMPPRIYLASSAKI